MKPQAAAGNAMAGGMDRGNAYGLAKKKMAARPQDDKMALNRNLPGKLGGLGNPMMQERLNAIRQQGGVSRQALGRGRPDFTGFPGMRVGQQPAFGNPDMDLDTGQMPGNPFASREGTIAANIPSRPAGGMARPGGMNPFSERLRQTGYNPAMMNSAVAKLRPTGMSDMSSGPPPIRATNPDMLNRSPQWQQAIANMRLRNQGGF